MRLLYWFYRRSHGMWRWLGRRLTPSGGFVLAGALLASTLATSPDQAVAYQAFALLFVLLLVGLMFAPWLRARVILERRLPRFATLGEPLRYRVLLRNLSNSPASGLELIDDCRGTEASFETFLERVRPGRRMRNLRLSEPLPPIDAAVAPPQSLPRVAARGSVESTAEVIPLRRGPLRFRGAWIARRDPLGLIRALNRVTCPGSVLVLPKRYAVPATALPGQTRYQHGGVTFASGVGESEEFVGVREYRRGDSWRRIHWRATARMGRPVVREHQDEFFVRHALVLDTFCDPSFDAVFEEAVSVAASFACTVPDQESLLDLLFVGPKLVCATAGRGVGHTEHLLETLACARPCRENRFAELRDLVIRHAVRVSGCILVLLEWDSARQELVRRLKAARVPVWVLLLVPPQEPHLPKPPFDCMPDRFAVLESGKVAEGLNALKDR